jgi:DNA processing protein
MNTDASYWIALAHLPRWGYARINALIVRFYHEQKITPEALFQRTAAEWIRDYGLNPKEVADMKAAKDELPNNAFLAEQMENEGYHLIPIVSAEYSKTLKMNLKSSLSPPLLYVKGNHQLLQQRALAVVGSRNAPAHALAFANRVVKQAVSDGKVVVSGFAKGVDQQALDSAIAHKGRSIIVLPQGIMTFGTGFRKYYTQVVNGEVLVLSVFPANVPWNTGLAMARNPIIYGLADEIVVAESGDSGGTWMGVMDGLKRGRTILVRNPEPGEANANATLIQKGGIPVDENGVPMPVKQNPEQLSMFPPEEGKDDVMMW